MQNKIWIYKNVINFFLCHKKNRNEEFIMKKLTKKQIKKMIKEKEYRKLRKLIPPECVCEQCKIKYGYK